MRKKILLLFLAFAGLLGLAACTVESEPSLTSIAFAGVEDLEVENGEAFNFLTGVTATGNDEVDYTDLITMTTTSSAVNVDTGELDTLQTGVHFVRYEVVVGEGESELVARHSRYITVKAPTVQEGELVVNPDMTDSISGWNDPSVVYIADGASMELSHEDGSLKAEVVAGSNFFTPRFGQMGVPFENGKTYEVSFRAKSSVEKEIALQVGELLAAAPWYVDFLPATIYRTIGTEWATYSYKFTMNQPEENLRGGILFGLGTVNGNAVNATMYFDDINIEESQPDADTEGPVLEGVVPTVEITSDQTFDPALGVTATDFGFGDVTHLLVIEIYNEAGTKISLAELFPEEGATPGTYTIMYTVGDPLGNYTRYTTTLIITEPEDMLFKDTEELVDGEFSATPAELPLEAQDANYQDITENGFWYRYDGSWSGAAATIAVNEAGQLVVDVTAVAGEPWHFMVKQKGLTLLGGETYKLSFDAVASVARPMRAGFNPLGEAQTIQLTTELQRYELMFENDGATVETRLELLFGDAVGTVTIDNVTLELGMMLEDIIPTDSGEIVDGSFSTSPAELPLETQDANYQDITENGFWYRYDGSWSGAAATIAVTEGQLVVDVTAVAGEPWHFMVKQKGMTLEKDTMYMLMFEAVASVERPIRAGFNPGVDAETFTIGTELAVYEMPFYYEGETAEVRLELLFGDAVGQVTIDNVMLYKGVYPPMLTFEDSNEFVDGGFDTSPADLPVETQDANYQDITETGFWYRYDGSWSGAAASIAVTEGQLVVDVTAVAGEPWHFMVKQKGISLEQGRFYILMFDAVASVERPIRVGFNPGVDAASLTIGTEMATYEMPFYYEGESVETRLELLFGDAVGTVTIDNVKLMVNEVPSQALTVTQVWDAGFSTWYEDYTDVTLRGLVVGFHDKGYVLQDPATAEMIAIHDSTNTPVLGDHVELVGQFNQSFDIARIKNVSSLTVLEQGLAPNWDTSNAVELPWTDLANFDIALYQGKLVKVTGLWAKLYSGDTSYARIAHDEAGTGSKQYDGAYIGLQNKANEMNLTGTLADIFTGLDTATEYSGLTLYLFFYDSTSSYEKAVILTDAFIVNPA